MAVKKGQFAKVNIQTGSDATTGDPIYTELMKLREWSVSISSEKIDSTSAGDDYTSHEIGLLSWEGDATCVDVDTFWFAKLKDKVSIEFYNDTSDTVAAFVGTASLDIERSVSYTDLIETSVTFTGSGAITEGV